MNNLSIREWQKAFANDEFTHYLKADQIRAGWYDWFCNDIYLRDKTYRMGSIIKQITSKCKVDIDNSYVFFKNNCPMVGPLYDDFRICDLETGDVQFTITVDDKRQNHKYSVYGIDNHQNEYWEKPMIEFDNKRQLVKWLNTKWEE